MKDKIKIDLETGLMVDIVPPSEHGDDIIETPCDIPYHLPKWTGTEWVEGGVAPEPTPPVPTEVERIEAMEEALDFFLMGGM